MIFSMIPLSTKKSRSCKLANTSLNLKDNFVPFAGKILQNTLKDQMRSKNLLLCGKR